MLLTRPLSIEEVNNLISENFIRIFGNIVEHFPAAAIAILKKRPFTDINSINQAMCNFLNSLKIIEIEIVLQLYPDVINQYLSQLPSLEREISGKGVLSVKDKSKLGEVNVKYREKFGFPFIIGGKEKDIFTIFSEITSRLQNNREYEIQVAMREVRNIVELRIHEIVR